MAVKVDFEGHIIEMRNRLNGAALFIDGQQVAVSGGLVHAELNANLPDGRLVTVKVSSGWVLPHYTVIVDNKVIYNR